MNEHDSERMKGMLESLGYGEAPERARGGRDPVQHLLDPRVGRQPLHRASRRGQRLKREQPERVVGVGGCWAQSLKDEVFERFPFVDVAFGPGQVHKLAEFLTSDSLSAQGYFEFEGFTGHLPARRARPVPGLAADQRRLQLRAAPTASCPPRAGARSPARRGDPRRGAGDGRGGRARGDPARAERQLLRARPADGRTDGRAPSPTFARAARSRSTRSTGSSASATRARTRRTCART